MTTINTTDDLLSLLRDNQEFREAVRQAILSEELLALPAVFNAFASEIRNEVKELKDGQQRLEQGQQGHTDDIGELKGIGLETKLYNRGVALIATLLKVQDSRRIGVAEMDDNSAEFNSAIYKAMEDDILTEEEYDRVLDTDMIISSRRPASSNPVYTAIEASYGVSRRDIAKVKQTAAILSKVFHEAEIHTALYCMNIASVIEEEAVPQRVHLIRARTLLT